MQSSLTLSLGLVFAFLMAFSCAADPPTAESRVKVTVATILASKANSKIDKWCEGIAPVVQRKDPDLLGFRLGTTGSHSGKMGENLVFDLVDDQKVEIQIQRCDEHPDRYCLKVKSPSLCGCITYSSVCGKYFPIDTRYETKKTSDRVIIAIMVQPCVKK